MALEMGATAKDLARHFGTLERLMAADMPAGYAFKFQPNAVAGAVLVFILPPSMEELERRLRARGTDSDETIQRRMLASRAEGEAWNPKITLIAESLSALAGA